MNEFWEARGLKVVMERDFAEPRYNKKTGVVNYVRKTLCLDEHWGDRWFNLVEEHGLYQHGTHMECLAAIVAQGLKDTCKDDLQEDGERVGCRTLLTMNSRGVYMYKKGERTGFPDTVHGYSPYTHMFGDGWCFSVALTLIGDYEQHIPSLRHQVVIPSNHVEICNIEIHVTRMANIPRVACLRPVWIGETEANFAAN